MKIKALHSLFFICLWCASNSLLSQHSRFLQLDISGGISQPVQGFSGQHMFAGQGIGISGGFDYFFRHFGIGISAGQFTNKSQDLFNSYLEHKYLEKIALTGIENWNTKYVTFGPTLKLGGKRLEFDLYAKGGYSQINVPDLLFTKTFFNQYYEVYHFSGNTDSWQFAWSGGTRLTYKLNHWMGIQAKADYFTTSYLSKINYDNTFRNAADGNRNGKIEDTEYFEAQKISNAGTSDLSVLNINMGLIFQLGKPKPEKITQIIPAEINQLTIPVTDVPQKDVVSQDAEPIIVQEMDTIKTSKKEDFNDTQKSKTEVLTPTIEVQKSTNEPRANKPTVVAEPTTNSMSSKTVNIDDIPIINAHEAPQGSEPVEIPETSYDAPEAKYDEEAAEFLYKAGESYFATNDFENALPCFNKLKADPKYPRAKYMFALSLCAMGNCGEAKKEYKEFAKKYKEIDSRTLEIIFASHLERCSTAGKLKNVKANNNTLLNNKSDTAKNKSSEPPVASGNKEYRIQFIAMKKPNATFPKLADVGNITTEFFPNMSVFRYTLTGYKDIKLAAGDVYKVRKMGFRDAFVAVYENGLRVNTLYHAK